MRNDRPGLPNFSVSPQTNVRKTQCKSSQITAKEFEFYFNGPAEGAIAVQHQYQFSVRIELATHSR
jgi:hypothetical protein